jgi:magnesium chelatase family protein
VQSATTNAGFSFPRSRISVNLAPADVQKTGCAFDVPIALAMLKATGAIAEHQLAGVSALGELSLAGEIGPIRGILALAESIRHQGFNTLLVPKKNAEEASLIKGLNIRIVEHFGQLTKAILSGTIKDLPIPLPQATSDNSTSLDMQDVVGQAESKRAILIAAAGEHNLVMVGGPGSGKSMMAHRLPSIFPPLSYEESITLTKIYSIAGLTISGSLITKRPFRSPHHSITRAGLVGGGSGLIRPGEVSLSSFGVLFLDEFLEFPRVVLEVLRQPLEDGVITISRANCSITLPANFSLIGALNPCPCGYYGQQKQICHCSSQTIERYQGRFSGPLVDRIDLYVNVPPVNLSLMNDHSYGESSASMRERVVLAREWQRMRFGKVMTNGKMTRRDIREFSQLTERSQKFLITCSEKLNLSARSFDRIIRVARTIADLEQSKHIHEEHIGEALHYRPMPNFMKQ